MAKTKIPYADVNWPIVTGCSGVGCQAQCWARAIAKRFGRSFEPTFHPEKLDEPLRWRKPRRVLVAFTGDLFDRAITKEQIQAVVSTIRRCPRHTFLLLTKRAQRLRDVLFPEDNLWVGVSVCNQREADSRWDCLSWMADNSWISAEPLLGPITMRYWATLPRWVVAAAESGPRARPCNLDWARQLRDECKEYGVPFMWKDQTGFPPIDGVVHKEML